jgi:transposase
MKAEEHAYVEAVTDLGPELARLRDLAQEFRRILREKDPAMFDRWLREADESLLRGFAASLKTDLAAVRAAVEQPWSNGPTEGHGNRLKLIKRSMFGRAGFDLLRERVLHAA